MDNLKCIVENVYSHIQQNEGAMVTKYELVKLSSKPYLNAMLQDNLVSLIRKTGIYALKLEISHTMPESTAPAPRPWDGLQMTRADWRRAAQMTNIIERI